TQTYFAPVELLEQTAPRAPAQARILSPFDNCLIQRDRVADLFGFDYQIECYVPAAQRKYGYFCLPILFRDGFVGRLDCKTHRDKALLEIKSIHIEQDKELDTMLVALREAVGEFARFQGADRITVGQVYPQHLSRQTQRLLSVE
ncbi:MAG: crosslink repair DNA glycosylase YcaQ family protein, partial [Pseudomonadales bacterium]